MHLAHTTAEMDGSANCGSVLGGEGSPTADASTISQTRGAYYVSCILQSNEEGLAFLEANKVSCG